jgi:hypothetical protein
VLLQSSRFGFGSVQAVQCEVCMSGIQDEGGSGTVQRHDPAFDDACAIAH